MTNVVNKSSENYKIDTLHYWSESINDVILLAHIVTPRTSEISHVTEK